MTPAQREQLQRWAVDAAERTGATAAAAAASYAIVELADKPFWWAPTLTTAFTLVKVWGAAFVGRKGTGSLLPAEADPASGQ